jgi:hypothetical protein
MAFRVMPLTPMHKMEHFRIISVTEDIRSALTEHNTYWIEAWN